MSSWLFILSILSGLLSYSFFNIGFALEKKAISKLSSEVQNKIVEMIKHLLRSKTWLLGFFLTLFSVVLYFIALTWAPLSAIAPLSGFGLVILITFAHIDLHESFNIKEIIGMVMVIVGISASSYFTSLNSKQMLWDEWNVLAHSYTGLIILLSSIVLGLILPIVFILKAKHNSFYAFAVLAGIAAGIQTVIIKGITLWFSPTNYGPVLFIVFLYIGGFLLTALASTGGLQLAFREGKVTNIMALYNGFVTIIPILFGGIVLLEWQDYTILNKTLLGISISIALSGIIIISLEHSHQSSDNNL
ncbi:MAG: EamA family transporter [Candidatus Heimdallarchaeota archaeon]|nr:EamA family transporter [Candidatus Heimdallarchaeota archaeon]